VCPAIDTRQSNVGAGTLTWVNPQSIQIFSSGMDVTYGVLGTTSLGNNLTPNVLMFPTGENYSNTTTTTPPNRTYTYDDVTNFSGGTLNDAIP
jgi:hypothetical protein